MLTRLLRGWPLPVWVYPGMAVLMAVLTFVVNLSLLRSAFPLWSQVSAAWHESLLIPGAVLAALAAPIGSALSQPASPVVPGGRPREGAVLTLGHAVALGAWAAVGHAVGMTPASVRAAGGTTWGVLNWQDVAVGSLGVVLLAVIGFCAGLILRRWLLAPLVGFAVFVALFLPDSPLLRPLGLFSPVRQFQTSTRFEVTLATTVFGAIAMVCVALAVTHLVTWARRRGAAYQHPTDALAWTGAVLVLGVTAFLWRPELYTVDRPVPRTCQDADGVQVCLHRADEPVREEVADATTALARAGLDPLMTQVTDYAAAETDQPGPGEAFLDIDPGPFGARQAVQNVRERAVDAIAAQFTVDRCPIDTAVYDSKTYVAAPSEALRARVLTLAGFERLNDNFGAPEASAAEFFNAMEAPELTDWVQQHQDQVETCTIRLPGQGR